MSKKILIVYASAGMGHVKASLSIEEAFKAYYPEADVKRLDIFNHVNYFWLKILRDGYHYFSSKKPGLWHWFYRHSDKQNNQGMLNFLAHWAVKKSYFEEVNNFKPDFFIAVHPLPVKLLDADKNSLIYKVPLATVITDYGCHSYWLSESVNYYFVAADAVVDCLKNYKIDPKEIIVSGIPIEQKFTKKLDKNLLIEKLSLDPNKYTILIVGGQFDFSTLKKLISGIKEKHPAKVQFLIVAGRDHDLEAKLNKSDLYHDVGIKIFGFVDNMQELTAAADLIFSKAGGLTVSECLAQGLPMVINKVIPGQEEDNVNFLVGHKTAIRVKDTDGIVEAVNNLISNPQELKAMKEACQKVGKPNSGKTIVDFVMGKINEK